MTGLWVNRIAPRALPQRAGNARQRKVVERRSPTCCHRDNVIDVERGFLASLGEATVFASTGCTFHDTIVQICRNVRHRPAAY